VNVIAVRTLREFWTSHPDAEGPLQAWYAEATAADWAKPQDIKDRFPSADFVGDRVVFNLKGNTYRLIVAVYFPGRIMFIKFIGTHAEYDKVDAETVSYTR
jgi:mRNA interferase HigB